MQLSPPPRSWPGHHQELHEVSATDKGVEEEEEQKEEEEDEEEEKGEEARLMAVFFSV